MTDDLVKQLNKAFEWSGDSMLEQAADRIEALEAKLAEETRVSNMRGNMIELDLLPSLHDAEVKLAKAVEALEKAPDAVRSTTLDDGPRLPEDSLGVWLAALDACANITQAYVSATITEIEGGEDD
jgi:hypothetical protein